MSAGKSGPLLSGAFVLSTRFSPQLDPATVLGVAPTAALEEIRDAYRAKAKKYHPDAGGDEWAFQILAKAYELMSVARVVMASNREETRPRSTNATPPPPPRPGAGGFGANRPKMDRTETVRPGVKEESFHPTQVVEVETMSVRYEADHVWLITEHGSDQRLLSCSMNITWPNAGIQESPELIPHADIILKSLDEVFNALTTKSKPLSAKSSVVEGRFTGWLSYPNNELAQAAFDQLRETLHSAGLVVNQWSRDLIIPRQWK